MQFAPHTIFSLAPVQRLLDEEWAVAMQRAGRVAAGPALSISPLAGDERKLPASRPGSCVLHVHDEGLDGDVRCTTDALPWQAATFDLLIVRHALDALPADCGLGAELARVLAPGGTLLLFGFNALSPWRLWSVARRQSGTRAPRCSRVASAASALRGHGLEPTGHGYLGGRWPGDGSLGAAMASGSRWDAAWMLAARKQAVAMRPIPIAAAARRAKTVPALVATPSRRMCA